MDMIYVYKDRIVNIEWTVLKGTSNVKENFDRALVKMFLIGPHEKYVLDANAVDGVVSAEVPKGLPEGVYSVEIIYIKNWLGVDRAPDRPRRFPVDCRGNDRCIMRTRKDNLFGITEYESEATNVGEGEVVVRVKTSTASYGYDGLSAYEIAVMRGDFEGTEGEWLEWTHERIVTDVRDLLDKMKSRDTRFVVRTKEQRDSLKDLREGDEVYVIDDGMSYVLRMEGGQMVWHAQDYGSVTAKYMLSMIADLPNFVADRAVADEFGKRIVDEYLTRDAVRRYMSEVFKDLFIENPPTIMDGMITVDMLSDAVKQLIGFGPIVNFPDDEFLTTKNGRITLKDRNYDPNNYSGMGRKVLRKNMVNGVNVLTQRMMSCPNTVYVITYDFDLRGEEITVPEGCVLEFEGGSLRNGNLIFTESLLEGDVFLDIIPKGTIRNKQGFIEWFKGDTSIILQFLVNSGVKEVVFGNNTYIFKEVILDKDIIISGNNKTIFKPILIREEDSDITHSLDSCRNMLQSYANDVFITIRNINFKSSITSNTLSAGYKTDKYASEPLLFFSNAKRVEVTNCVFDSIEGNSYSSTDYTYYGNKKGLCLCCWDCNEVSIHDNYITKLRMDEQFWVIAVHKERESLVTRFKNNYVENMAPAANSSLFTSVAGTVEFSNNFVNNFVYSGSLVNLFGTHVIAQNNVITNTQVSSVFDTSEYGYFYANDILISDNFVEALSGSFVVTISNNITVRDNKFKGFVFLIAENNATINQMGKNTYPYFYTKDTVKSANTYIFISENNIDLTYYDKTIVRIVPNTYSKGINIRSWQTMGGKFIFKNNIMTSLQSFDSDDVNNMGNYSVIPLWLSNMKQIIIEDNSITGGGIGNNITSVKAIIWAGHHYTYDQGEVVYTLDRLSIKNNNFSTNGNYILLSTTSQYNTKWYTITKFEFTNNIAVGEKTKSILWTLPVIFSNSIIEHNVNLQLQQYPFVNIHTDITDLGYILGRIEAYRKFRESYTNTIVHTTDLTSEYQYNEINIEVGTRLEVGTQVQMSDYTIWKNIGTVVSWKESSNKEIQTNVDIMKYQGVFWRKLLSRKKLFFDSHAVGTSEERVAMKLDPYYYGLSWYEKDTGQYMHYNNVGWTNEDGTLTSKVVII